MRPTGTSIDLSLPLWSRPTRLFFFSFLMGEWIGSEEKETPPTGEWWSRFTEREKKKKECIMAFEIDSDQMHPFSHSGPRYQIEKRTRKYRLSVTRHGKTLDVWAHTCEVGYDRRAASRTMVLSIYRFYGIESPCFFFLPLRILSVPWKPWFL